MNWAEVPMTEHVNEAAAVVGEAELVIEFSEDARGWFRVAVFEDLRAESPDARYFARATEKTDGSAPGLEAIATGPTPEAAATFCIRETGITLRRARGR
jgi:hypothetical protein